jgi:hypothetical protein
LEYNFSLCPKLQPYERLFEPFFNLSSFLPSKIPITPEQYKFSGILWQAVLSSLAFDDSDPYIIGTGKSGMIGFSLDDYSLKYIGLRVSMCVH